MKNLFPVKVVCHSGYIAGEYPESFYFESTRFDVEEIIDRWYQISYSSSTNDKENDFSPANYFKVRTTGQKIYILKHEKETDEWFLWVKGESLNLSHNESL